MECLDITQKSKRRKSWLLLRLVKLKSKRKEKVGRFCFVLFFLCGRFVKLSSSQAAMAVSIVLMVFLSLLHLLAFGLTIAAERTRSTGVLQIDEASMYQWCYYSSNIAAGLGAGALLSLLSSQALLTVATRCVYCGNSLKPGAAQAFAIIFVILNWIAFIIAESCLSVGVAQNVKRVRFLSYFGTRDRSCGTSPKDSFAAGEAFIIFTFIFSITYYVCHAKAKKESWKKIPPKGEARCQYDSWIGSSYVCRQMTA